ncbi:hypothetical protein ABZX66_20970 [Micromonospora aurantiaca]|uniref:hypothetical protein n=1 Tax=Micromonospora aurantiaca (nom. illeg.) TaxID=47850 RepID=UPI0033BCBE4A
MGEMLRTEEDIRDAGADAVAGWEIPDHVVEQLVTLISPALHGAAAPATSGMDSEPA